ncbi:hypothetical protein, partial [Campylobacter devanensis]|uniref:hypothetical protein n=1 Tax=Campylobacter devanensis TaxID=3161138 RepID=UPI001F4659C4
MLKNLGLIVKSGYEVTRFFIYLSSFLSIKYFEIKIFYFLVLKALLERAADKITVIDNFYSGSQDALVALE